VRTGEAMAGWGPAAHGGALVDLRVDEDRAEELTRAARTLPAWELTRRQRCDLELLADGGFSPLRTFLDQVDYETVCASMRLATGELWPIPVTLDLPESVVEAASAAGGLTLRARGADVGVIWVRSAWRPDRTAEALAVFGSTDPTHPGVHALLHDSHPWCVSGPLEVLELPRHHAFRSLRHTPGEVRTLLAQRGWDRVVAFQTRNPMHRAHQELTIRAARDVDAQLLLHPVVGMTKPGDVDPYVRVRCYRALLPTYPPGTTLLSLLPLAMRMAGPREALWHAIVRKNHGATHFIVGRDHAAPGVDLQGRPFYAAYAAQDLVRQHERELGIGMVPFRQMVYVEEVQQYVPEDEVQPGHHCLRISGTEQRRRLAEGEELPSWFTPPEVAKELRRAFPARSERGVGVLVRATLPDPHGVAAVVAALLREAGRTVTVVGGHFSAADSASAPLLIDLVREVMRNGGAVVCCGEAADRVGDAGPGLVRYGLVLDVGASAKEVGPGSVREVAGECAQVRVAPGITAEAVGETVCSRLGQLGYVDPVSPPTHQL
jgi:sulfate adenylyltransferase